MSLELLSAQISNDGSAEVLVDVLMNGEIKRLLISKDQAIALALVSPIKGDGDEKK